MFHFGRGYFLVAEQSPCTWILGMPWFRGDLLWRRCLINSPGSPTICNSSSSWGRPAASAPLVLAKACVGSPRPKCADSLRDQRRSRTSRICQGHFANPKRMHDPDPCIILWLAAPPQKTATPERKGPGWAFSVRPWSDSRVASVRGTISPRPSSGPMGPWGHRCKPCKPAPFGGFGRNLAEFNEEPKSAIEGLEGLALEYTWQELHQARGCKQREQKTLRELRERRRLTAFQRLASWVQVPVVRPSPLCLESHRSYKVDESEVAVVCIRYSLPCYTVRGDRSGCEGWKLRT